MIVTREIFDNDKLIMHVNYERVDLAKLRKKVQIPTQVVRNIPKLESTKPEIKAEIPLEDK